MDILSDIWDTSLSVLFTIVPYALFFFFIEQFNKLEKDVKFIKGDTVYDLTFEFLNTFITAYFTIVIVKYYTYYVLFLNFDSALLSSLSEIPFIFQVLISLLIFDLFTYWQHRLLHMHAWSIHAIHHSSDHMNWLSGLRLHPFERIIQYFFTVTALFFIGLPEEAIHTGMIITVFLNYLNHANIKLKYIKPFRYIVVSPHYHRWHHADQKDAYDKNFSTIFPLWDILFGTYYHPEGSPAGYGLSAHEQKHFPKTFRGMLNYPIKKGYKKAKKRFSK